MSSHLKSDPRWSDCHLQNGGPDLGAQWSGEAVQGLGDGGLPGFVLVTKFLEEVLPMQMGAPKFGHGGSTMPRRGRPT
jgi:hypothetical protein